MAASLASKAVMQVWFDEGNTSSEYPLILP